ncbi:MAG: helix-turn-helix transcriptional regulator, partial [Clostridia bacterium]|nr:helix-turn-helix transcriptional regulator [Clostridia bacterium]
MASPSKGSPSRRTGRSLTAYIRRVRLFYAVELMTRGGLSPVEAAEVLGYYDCSHFFRAFRREYGVAPPCVS